MNYLLVTFGYCGESNANGLCAKTITEQLRCAGNQVYIVSYGYQPDSQFVDDNVCSFYYLPKEHTRKNILQKSLSYIKAVLLHSFIPKYDKKLVSEIINSCKKICQNQKIDVLLPLFFPIEAVIACKKLKEQLAIKYFIICELDSVGDGVAQTSKKAFYSLHSYNFYLPRIYNRADAIMVLLCHEKFWKDSYRKFIPKLKIFDLPLICEIESPDIHGEDSSIRFVYSGVLNMLYRSPKTMIESFTRLNAMYGWKLDLFSKGCEDYLLTASSAVMHGYIDSCELNLEMAKADFFINIGNCVSNSVPSKLFFYMSYGKPIIHFKLQKNDICERYLEKYPLSLIIDTQTSPDKAAEFIKKFVSDTKDRRVCMDYLKSAFPMNLPEYFSRILSEVLIENEY